jgi:hypothetical protein
MQIKTADIDSQLWRNWLQHHDPAETWQLRQRFERDGFIILREAVTDELRQRVRDEVFRLLEENAERRDLRLATTGNTARRMSVVQSEKIGAGSSLIRAVYDSPALRRTLQTVAGAPIFSCPSIDEEFLITRQDHPGDTHGWHWGDFSYALIWIIEMPPTSFGGMLQCVPHTRWDKQKPCINEHLCNNPILTYGFRSGDLYFLKTDTTLHRTVPLNRDCVRVILNMTYAGQTDRLPTTDDRWWENADATAATQTARVSREEGVQP